MKTCCICKESLDLSVFGKDKNSYDGLTHACKPCRNKRAREVIIANPEIQKARNAKKAESRKKYYRSERGIESSRRAHLKCRFGITLEHYNKMLDEQQGKCAICDQPETSSRNSMLAVDHDHDTGQIRALLCTNCNTGIGLLRDNSSVLKSAVKYLEKYNK